MFKVLIGVLALLVLLVIMPLAIIALSALITLLRFHGTSSSTVSARSPCESSTARPWPAARSYAIRVSSNVDLPVAGLADDIHVSATRVGIQHHERHWIGHITCRIIEESDASGEARCSTRSRSHRGVEGRPSAVTRRRSQACEAPRRCSARAVCP
jgi:hypothetical protein